jgi:hypothetical protein
MNELPITVPVLSTLSEKGSEACVWRLALMRILRCLAETTGELHEDLWRDFGISEEDRETILATYARYYTEQP